LCVCHLEEVCSLLFGYLAHVAQMVEHVLGKDEVTGSIPVVGLKITKIMVLDKSRIVDLTKTSGE
jgi:hypothetical protein